MTVDTSFDTSEGSTCISTNPAGLCILPFAFVPQGFSVDSHYQVAARSAANEPWELFDALQISFDAPTSVFAADIPIDTLAQGPSAVFLQTAVLVFVDQPPLLPASELIENLAESGADFAFVSPEQEVQVRP
jgi:hypothetical protein